MFVSLTSGFHPQTNGQTERINQEVEAKLRCMVCAEASSWSRQLPWVEYAHNMLPSFSLGCSPFQAAYGYQPPLFPEQMKGALFRSIQRLIHRCDPPGKEYAPSCFGARSGRQSTLIGKECLRRTIRTSTGSSLQGFIGPFLIILLILWLLGCVYPPLSDATQCFTCLS